MRLALSVIQDVIVLDLFVLTVAVDESNVIPPNSTFACCSDAQLICVAPETNEETVSENLLMTKQKPGTD